MRALVAGENGFKLLSQVLIIMLQTLLQDRLAEVATLCHLLISRSGNFTHLPHLKVSLHHFSQQKRVILINITDVLC